MFKKQVHIYIHLTSLENNGRGMKTTRINCYIISSTIFSRSVRNRPPVKQGSEETIRFAQEKKTGRTPADFVPALHINQGKASKTGVTGKLCADSKMQPQIEKKGKIAKIVGQVCCNYV